MIYTVEDIKKFQIENVVGDWIIHIVPLDDKIHSANNKPSIFFIKNIETSKIYYYIFNHPDSLKKVITDSDFINEILLKSENIKWAVDKKSILQYIPIKNVYDVNLYSFIKNNEILNVDDYETIIHKQLKIRVQHIDKFSRVVPILKHKEMFSGLCDDVEQIIKKYTIDQSFLNINNIIIPTLSDLEKNGIYVNPTLFKKYFDIYPNDKNYVYSQYNIYTSTGRPSNRYDSINYAAIPQNDGSRSAFISRFSKSGKMILIDYAAFHPRIVCNLINYPLPTDIDIYSYLAKLYFNKQDIDETDISNAKKLTFKQFYGGIENKYSHIKYLSNLKKYINIQWEFYKTYDYVLTPIFNRKITNNHIKGDASPYKIFNYILQAAEGEIAISRLNLVMDYLKNKNTCAVLYTYDSILYDFCLDDKLDIIYDIINIMSFDGKFPLKIYIGDSYHDLKLIDIKK